MASMKFCRVCNNMLYPKENKETRTLMMACRNCVNEETADDSCVYRHEIVKKTETQLNTIPADVVQDPSLQRGKNVTCRKCGTHEAVFFQAKASQASEDRMAIIFVCISCRHRWQG